MVLLAEEVDLKCRKKFVPCGIGKSQSVTR